MSEREDIKARVRSFRQHQERLCAERDERMDRVTQEIRQTLSEMHAREDGAVRKYRCAVPTL